MKNVLIVCSIFCMFTQLLASEQDNFQVILEPFWQDLENNDQKAQEFGGKWILAGSITFKKKAKDTLHLRKIYLQWHGKNIENLNATLYLKDDDEKFLPIQDNVVCDGIWNKAQQTIMLNFEEDHTLGPTNIFYLVLTVPKKIEPILKKGYFALLPTYLPEPYKMVARKKPLSIAYNNMSIYQPDYPKKDFPHQTTQMAIDVVHSE